VKSRNLLDETAVGSSFMLQVGFVKAYFGAVEPKAS
jgi:hypothetical protein